MRGSIVRRKGKHGTTCYVVVRNRWYRVPDPPGGAQTNAHVEAFQARLLAELERGSYTQPQRITMAAFVERWKAVKYPELSPNTAHAYDTALQQLVLPVFGERLIGTITREDIEGWKAGLMARYAPASINVALIVLRGIYGTAIDWKYLSVSPLDRVHHRRGRQREVNPLSPDQLRKLLGAVNPRWRAIILLAATGGLRQGEVGAARWANLDLEARTYLVTETLVGHPRDGQVIRPPKSIASRAKVLLSPACCAALAVHRTAQLERRLARGEAAGGDEGWMFAWPGNGYPHLSTMCSQWLAILRRTGLQGFRFHDLRHTCAALLVDVGAHPKVIQQQLRHSSIGVTLDIYGHLFPQRVDEAVAAIDARVGLA